MKERPATSKNAMPLWSGEERFTRVCRLFSVCSCTADLLHVFFCRSSRTKSNYELVERFVEGKFVDSHASDRTGSDPAHGSVSETNDGADRIAYDVRLRNGPDSRHRSDSERRP